MSKASDAANAVVNAAEQVCTLYGVDKLRMQSRVVQMEGTAGRWRPYYFGRWMDRFGNMHNKGMADLLARPRVPVGEGAAIIPIHKDGIFKTREIDRVAGIPIMQVCLSVPLWIECKSGTGKLTPDQRAFKAHVEWNGETYIEIHDDVRPLIEWFDANGIKKCEHCGGKRWMHKIGETPVHCPKCDPRK